MPNPSPIEQGVQVFAYLRGEQADRLEFWQAALANADGKRWSRPDLIRLAVDILDDVLTMQCNGYGVYKLTHGGHVIDDLLPALPDPRWTRSYNYRTRQP